MSSKKISPFFLNRAVEQFASKPSTPISLKHLINFGKARGSGEEEKLLKGGNFLRTELPTRLSHRLRDLQSLPFIVASNPHMVRVYELYLEAFEKLRRLPPLVTMQENDAFCKFCRDMMDEHRVVIPELAIGIAESSPTVLPPAALDAFVTKMLRSRISRRVVTEQHIALTHQYRERQRKGKGVEADDERMVGVVDTRLNAAEVARHCAALLHTRGGGVGEVPVLLDGDLDSCFAYIPEHLEFMLYELIKHAAFMTEDYHGAAQAKDHPIRVTIVNGAKDLAIRVSDEGGGIPPWGGLPPSAEFLAAGLNFPTAPPTLTSQRLDIFSFSHMRRLHLHSKSPATASILDPSINQSIRAVPPADSPASDQPRVATELLDSELRSGMIGLPLAEMFAGYFSGSLTVQTVQGLGSDSLLTIPRIML